VTAELVINYTTRFLQNIPKLYTEIYQKSASRMVSPLCEEGVFAKRTKVTQQTNLQKNGPI